MTGTISDHSSQMVQFCADNIKNITGRVLVQVSPSRVMSKERVLEQCYSFDRAFASHGISRYQYAIKISTTGPAMAAATILRKQGIRVLGTSLSSCVIWRTLARLSFARTPYSLLPGDF